MDGMREEAARFNHEASDRRAPPLAGTPFEGARRYRTLGPDGPMYQVLELRGELALVWLSNSDEEIELPLADVLDNPLAP